MDRASRARGARLTKMPPALHLEPGFLERVHGAIGDIRSGKMVILVDDEDRENEGDLCMAAEQVTAESINFMATHGRGLICLTLTEEQVERLRLPMMHSPGRSGPALGTAFTVSVEARSGVTTGISAADRAHTTRVATSPATRPEELVTPGHVFPLRAKTGGVLVRTGQTEGSVDLARLAGLTPAGVICEIMNEDGSMARMRDLELFSKKHDLRILTIADLIQYRLQTERLVTRLSERALVLDETGTIWRAIAYDVAPHCQAPTRQFLALIKGDLDSTVPTLCRVHAGSTLADTFASTPWEGGHHLREAIRSIEAAGRGVIVYLPPRGDIAVEMEHHASLASAHADTVPEQPLREFGLGAQVLVDLGLHKIRLLTNNPRKIAGLHGYGLDVVEHIPLLSTKSAGDPGKSGELRG
jgi:3,4-dihydroxy 2-butanone 4-phosphate synthase/GTP cyclohydrolase II